MISVTILVKNGERHLDRVLNATKNFNDVILLDTGSTDKTLEIANKFSNVTVYKETFLGFGPSHNRAAALAKNDWILSVDADEVPTDQLASEILSLNLDQENIYTIPFRNYVNKKFIKRCGWYPEKHIRLYNRKKTEFSDVKVHEGILKKDCKIVLLKNHIDHYSYVSLSDFLVKMERYSTLFAEQNKNKRKSSPLIAIYHGLGAFLKCYFLKRGFLDGYEGFLISIYSAHTAFYKYLKLYESNREKPCS